MATKPTEPFSRDAEQAVLGAIMFKPAAYWQIADRITPDDFFVPWHRELYAEISALVRENQACDAVTLGEVLEQSGRIDAVGGVGYVIEIANNTPGAGNIVAYAEIVADKAELRRVRAAGRSIAMLDERGAAQEAAQILGAAARPAAHSVQSIKEVLREWHATFAARFERTSALSGVTTGLENLDAMTGGLQPGDLVLVAARPSMGKTAFALQLARASAEADAGVLIFTLEMSSSQLMERLMSSAARVGSDALRNPLTMETEEVLPRISAQTQLMAELPIRFDESGSLTIEGLLAKARQSHAKGPVRTIVVDYLQLITPPEAERHDIGLAAVTRALKALAKDLGATVILLSQLNRDCEKRQDKRPMMSDLRDSGAIEQDADIVMMLYRDEYYTPTSVDAGFVEVLIRKHRNGPVGTVPMRADMRFGRFSSADALPSSEVVEPTDKPRGFGRWRVKTPT